MPDSHEKTAVILSCHGHITGDPYSSATHAMLWLQALLINTVLIALAQRLPLLTRAGWVHAGILGTVLWGCLGWTGWVAVVAYPALGSAVTKLGFWQKQSVGWLKPAVGEISSQCLGSAATAPVWPF